MTYPLNEWQSKAVAIFDSDLVVTAGAGTGKTSVLTSKFIRLLEERRAEVGEIVAITFTNKAAAEMRSRIQAAVQEHLQVATGTEEAGYWKNQLLKLESARISTFHSLCLGLLREYPLEAGITPVTGILNESEAAVYLNQAATTALTREFHENTIQRSILIRLLQEYGWEQLTDDLIALYQTIRESGWTFAAALDHSAAKLRRQETYSSASLVTEIDELLEFSSAQKLTERAMDLITSFREEWPAFKVSLVSQNYLEETVPVLLAIRKALPGNLPNIIKDRVTAIHGLLEALSVQLMDRECLDRLPAVGILLERIDREYSRIKLEQGLVDFTDQQLLTRNLLQHHPELADQVRRGIKYLLVDEFQDTNGLQAELIGMLLGSDYQGGRLMAVGDIKQSIYRFRGAEAELISELSGQVRQRGGTVVALSQNYRSDQLVIDFVNRVSQRLFDTEPFEYEPLEATKSESGARIEFLLSGIKERAIEARLTAARIAQLVRESDGDAPVNYGDIVLLFRASASVFLYQQALQELGIPYYNSCGGDFYRRQEIVDQLNLLRLVQQRYDSLALLAMLTSPYVGLSEASLFWLGSQGNLVKEFYESREFSPEISASERERLYHFRGLLTDLQQQREYLQIPEILRTAIERCRYRELLWAAPNGSQRVANLEKLLVKADEFVANGFHDLNRFLAYIAKLEGVGVLEGEAPTEAELGNVVRLMTVHRSKGLEFPVVIIPELDRKFNFRKQGNLVFHKKVGLGMKIPLEGEATLNPSLLEEIKTRNRREEISELKRLLYVAMTRAKQKLILAGSGCDNSRGDTLETANSWMKWFELLMPLNEAGDFFEYEGIPIRVVRGLPEVELPPRAETVLENILPELETEELGLEAGDEVAATVETKAITNLKVTEILTYLNCPRRYFWQYRMRLKGFGLETPDFDASEAKDKMGTMIGEFMHQAAGLKNEEWPEELWVKMFGNRTDSDKMTLKEDLTRIWRNYRNSPYTGKMGSCWDEVPFLVKLTPVLQVEGRFDRLFRNQVGELILVDYKTHRVSEEQTKAIAVSYFPQLQLYALAVESLWGQLPNRAVLYFPYADQSVTAPMDRDSLECLVTEVERMADFVTKTNRPDVYPKRGDCRKCSYGRCCKNIL